MSLTVRIIAFTLPKPKANLIGRIEFRGVAHTTNELASKDNHLPVNQSFIWPLARAAAADEALVVELRIQSTRILMKTSSKSAGSSASGGARGTISSSSKSVGRYVMVMQGLIQRGHVRIDDRLTDANNQPIEVTVTFEVTYTSPDDAAGNFVPSYLNSSMHLQQLQQQQQLQQPTTSKQQKHTQYPRLDGSGDAGGGSSVAAASISGVCRQPKRTASSTGRPATTTMDDIGGGGDGGGGVDDDDDQQMLLNIEQNIVNLERSFGQTDALTESKHHKHRTVVRMHAAASTSFDNKPNAGTSNTVVAAAEKSDKSSASAGNPPPPPPADPPAVERGRRRLNMRTVRQFMKFGTKRRSGSQASRDSSTDDDGRSLMSDTDGDMATGGLSQFEDDADGTDAKRASTAASGRDEMAVATSELESLLSGQSSDVEEGTAIDSKVTRKRPAAQSALDMHLKAQDFQVCVTIIEARQLPGLNMDPVVCIQIGDQKKYTSVKESTNCPYYNEYFVFDFHMAPVMLFDKIITLSVLQSRNVLRPNVLVGSFKLDVATVWLQKGHQFFHKWALLTDPEDFISGPKGYLKCDIGIIGKGDTVKVPQKSEKDPDDIEANLLLPDGVPIERQRAKFVVKIYRADGLPRMNSSIMANMKRAFTGETKDLVSPFVQVSFAGLSGKTSVKRHSYAPVWNEQLVFTEMFPPLCQRIKIQLRDADPVKPAIIGTHYIDLKQISNDGEKGYLPTFGPSFINLYGSTRDYTLLDQHATLNTGLGEGVSYRARLLIAIRTEITDNVDICTDKNVELEPTLSILESSYSKSEEFFLFGTLMEASMIERRLHEKACYFELSMGNAGNSLDGHNESAAACNNLNDDDDDRLVVVDSTSYSSTTSSSKPTTHDRQHYYLPYWDYKPCMDVRCYFPDLRRRMYNSNMIAKMTEKMDEGLNETNAMLNDEDPRAEVRLRAVLEEVAASCAQYMLITKAGSSGPGTGKTKLDKERMKLCQRDVDAIGNMSRNLRALVTKNSMRERYKTAQTYLQKLRFLVDDPQHALPDIFVWLIASGKRIAYHRVSARDLIYSPNAAECGTQCGRMQTVTLKLPGKQTNITSSWGVQAKLTLYLWLGVVDHKRHYYAGLPRGYDMSSELRNADRVGALAPANIHYVEKHVFQLRAHIYQARSLIGSDASGLSDPYACVYITEFRKQTQVIEETLSPTWDELLVFDDILVYGAKEEIRRDPPTIVVEIYDQDKVGKSEFIGRTIGRPRVKLREDPYIIPTLEWFDLVRGADGAGELLAAFELLELGADDMPKLTEPKVSPLSAMDAKSTLVVAQKCSVLPVPRDVRPNLARFRIEVLFWGLRDLKRVHFMSVDKPRIDVECSGTILNSSIIQNAKRNPNFSSMLKFFDLELPVEENYAPPITIRCVDCRSFGRYTLVGTHQITSIHKYMHRPMPREEFKSYPIGVGQIVLTSPVREQELTNVSTAAPMAAEVSDGRAYDYDNRRRSSCENLTLYGAVCVGKTMRKKSQRRKPPLQHDDTLDPDDDYENTKDWWTKYFWSYEKLILESKEKNPTRTRILGTPLVEIHKESRATRMGFKSAKSTFIPSPKHVQQVEKNKASTALFYIYPGELESLAEYNDFKDWLLPFPLYRGKKTGDSAEDDNRIVGYFKGAIKVYRLPIAKGLEPAFAPTLPTNDPIHVLVRIYIVKATDLHPMDLNGKADPYVVLQLGNKRVSDKDNYVSKQLNPVFGKCFEIEATFPQDSLLTIQVLDWDLVGSDDLIGETRIDLENRFYSKHRATCGLARRYEENGYNRWRDPMKPTQILQRLCKENKLEQPHYFQDRVVISRYCMTFSEQEVLQWNGPLTSKNRDEHLALAVLHRWHEMPRIGCRIVPEHIESRPLFNPEKAGIEQGKLELWVDMFPMDMPLPGPPVDISPRKPKSYELRIVIWNTDDVVLEDDAFFTGEKMSDIYVKGWLKGPQDVQSTDIHYRSLTGEGNFNWRFIYPFEYLAAEERIVLSRRESMFSWDETEVKIPARLELQVWDADHFSADDFLGAISLNLNRFPRGAKSSKLCTLDMMNTDGVPTVNIFKQKRVRGWWPFYVKKENDEMELTGKVEAEIHLLTKEEAEQNPAGFGRNEPDGLEKPNRPDASFMWFLNPLKSIRYIVWHNYKWAILKGIIILAIAIMILLFFYSIPGYTVKRMLGA